MREGRGLSPGGRWLIVVKDFEAGFIVCSGSGSGFTVLDVWVDRGLEQACWLLKQKTFNIQGAWPESEITQFEVSES